jgi:UDP-N-acetylglucosamine 2-epimerase (non-hydrolysing)
MIALDPIIKEETPDFLLVVGDVNATVAGSLVAKQNGVKVIHVEA